ncbi:MAG: efflux RND transporter periplasmic adaptor subunit [Actinoplanes sp.]
MARTVRILVVVLVALGALAGAAVAWAGRPGGGAKPAEQPVAVDTVAIVRADMSTDQSLPGRLGYGTARPVKGAKEGIVTWLPAPGTAIARGRQLYRVDDRPVPLFYGRMPLFRTLDEVNTVGRDVQIVAANLKALGYSIGDQPRTGQTVVITSPASPASPEARSESAVKPGTAGEPGTAAEAEADAGTRTSRVVVGKGEDVLTRSMIKAVRKWQRDTGLPVTGKIEVGDLLVLTGPVRVDALDAQLGDPAQAPLMSVTPTAKVITVQAEAEQAGGIDKGDKVTVALPDGSPLPGKVTAVGTALRTEDGGENAPPKLTVTVTVDDPRKLARLDSADVEVGFTAETHEGVLVVPVGALVALSEGGYAVQRADAGLVAVDTGMFAKGLVEITGAGLDEGMTVVTTS